MMFGRKKKVVEPTTSLDVAAASLVTIGALNWGLVGLFGFDLVATLLGRRSKLSRLVYTAVGASAVYLALDAAD
ncbi:MAG: DUF378 domain-containing protein [Actinomycetota bacterium]|nr:DUF378 domain-containing protein [Actinomycetota bacterium]